ncbi:MAG: YabP/YqfC family sporulation protein [Clostridia bacterium]|nr:YabP/YqfC family sporulation protein [Clostridia bacterium]
MIEKYIDQQEPKKHTLQLLARQRLSLEGVTDVKSFDEQTVELTTDCGRLTVEGEEMHIGTLDIDGGAVRIEGRICGLYYSDEAPLGKKRRGGR